MTTKILKKHGISELTPEDSIAWLASHRPTPTLAELKADAQSRLASRRWQAETGGMMFNGTPVATDDRSKALIYGARGRSVKFKTASGQFAPLSASETEALADAVADHVQACFDRESDLLDAINAAETVEELEAVDINTGWPE